MLKELFGGVVRETPVMEATAGRGEPRAGTVKILGLVSRRPALERAPPPIDRGPDLIEPDQLGRAAE